MTQAQQILEEIPAFVEGILTSLKRLGLDVENCTIDHVCCRAGTPDDYSRLKDEFGVFGKMISEALIGGRPIATFKFHQPVQVGARNIACIEIPAPKVGQSYSTGLEHCEFVVADSFETLTARHPLLTWNWNGARKKLNAELALPIDSKRSVKFHHLALEKVIELEATPAIS